MDFDECKVLPLVYMDLFFFSCQNVFYLYLCNWQTCVLKFRDYPAIRFSQFVEYLECRWMLQSLEVCVLINDFFTCISLFDAIEFLK